MIKETTVAPETWAIIKTVKDYFSIHLDEDEIEEMKSLPDGGYDLDGKALFEDVAELLSLNIEDPEEETIGGYVFRLLGQKPMVGDQVKVGKWDVTVTETQGFRVVRLQVLPTDEPEVLLETEE